jgi:membrane-bound metal-dependent hydrolase YbcI (DUF457 family)
MDQPRYFTGSALNVIGYTMTFTELSPRMANFNTHLSMALVISTGAAIAAVNVNLITNADMAWLIFLGTLGGLLPDIDATNSKPAKMLFFILALIGTSAAIDLFKNSYPPYPLLGIIAGTYLSIRYVMFALFNKLTVHRGVFHSILAALFFALLTTCISYYIMHLDVLRAWVSGIFIALGIIVHLLLDEIYSVDLSNTKIKKSFGSALKLFSTNSMTASILMAICTLMLYWITPSHQPLAAALEGFQIESLFHGNDRGPKTVAC